MPVTKLVGHGAEKLTYAGENFNIICRFFEENIFLQAVKERVQGPPGPEREILWLEGFPPGFCAGRSGVAGLKF